MKLIVYDTDFTSACDLLYHHSQYSLLQKIDNSKWKNDQQVVWPEIAFPFLFFYFIALISKYNLRAVFKWGQVLIFFLLLNKTFT